MGWLAMLDLLGSGLVLALPIVLSGIVGYLFGAAKSFREHKHRAYAELLPPIIRMAYDPKSSNEAEFSQALMKLWLYGSKSVARKMDNAVSLFHHPDRGNAMRAFQEAVVEMRSDIQFWPWQRLKPEDVRHLYTKIVDGKEERCG